MNSDNCNTAGHNLLVCTVCKMQCLIRLGSVLVLCYVWVMVMTSVRNLGLGSGLAQKFANCACAVSKLHSIFCKLPYAD